MLNKSSKQECTRKLQRLNASQTSVLLSEPVTDKNLNDFVKELKKAAGSSSYCNLIVVSHR